MAIAGTAVLRAADALLRVLGGNQIGLVLPLPTETGSDSTQLGLTDPGVQQLTISPVVVRTLPAPSTGPRVRMEFLISASAVASAVDAEGAASGEALFDLALGIQFQTDFFHIESVSTEYFAGTAYLYRVVAVE
ncbi:MAG TPA: hypothetical protein VG322_14750 [Candidatus Acidoferrales bacterium]|jgi:hypothetical protein|nr:hypothetical protein [Candidatus Acidoferrales bacterium]